MVERRTFNPQVEGSNPSGPVLSKRSSVLCSESWNFTSEKEFSVPSFEMEEEGNGYDRKRAYGKSLSKKWPEIRKQLEFLGANLPKARLVNAITMLSDARKRRFLRSRRPKYGSMNKSFTEKELERFFRFVDEPRFKLLFSYQAVLGLRVGEAVRISVKDINLRNKELRIFTEKSGKTDFLLIPDELFESTLGYISAYEGEIMQAEGYLFFSLRAGNRRPNTQPHIQTTTVRDYFLKVTAKAGLDEYYGYRYGKRANPLRRLSTHSLRHFAITEFCKKNNGNVMLASRFARHTNLQTTQTYIHVERDELYRSIRNSQEGGILERVRRMQERV